ncbi:MAG: metal ABC transporter permease, partial [Chlamydiae bacterium]|nr:metal ABC transporter permease [Chlamydiota bacterium]
ANSLSHTILIGIVLAFLFASKCWEGEMFSLTTLLLGSFAASLLTAFLTEGLIRFFRLQEDASVGFVFSTLFALGVLLVTLFTKDVHLGTEAIMGNADALQPTDFRFAALLFLFNLSIVTLFYRKLQISSFDRHYANSLGISSNMLHFLLLSLSSMICVSAFRAVGVLLVLAFLTGPFLTARLFSHRLAVLLFLTPFLGALACFIAVAFSRHFLSFYGFPLSTGGIAVGVIGCMYGLAIWLKSFFTSIKKSATLTSN